MRTVQGRRFEREGYVMTVTTWKHEECGRYGVFFTAHEREQFTGCHCEEAR